MAARHMKSNRDGRSRRRWRTASTALVLCLAALACGSEGGEAEGEAPAGSTGTPAVDATPEATATAEAATEDEPGAQTEATAASCEGAERLAGEQLEIGIPFGPGGYDRQGRIIADALGRKYDVTPVVLNEPGAGGLVSYNTHVSTNADELRIQYVQVVGALASQLAGAEGAAQLQLAEWPWLAQVQVDPMLVIAGADSELESLEDVFAVEPAPKFGSYGPGSIEFVNAKILGRLFDSEVDLVTGFANTGEIIQSLVTGDIDAFSLSVRSLLPSIQAGDAIPLVLLTREPVEELPDVPVITELAGQAADDAVLQSHLDLLEIGRAFAAVPGADEETVEVLRCMLRDVLDDEDVVAAIEQEEGNHVAYLPGPEVQELIAAATDSDEEYVAVLEESF